MRSSWLPPVLESVEVGDHLGHVVVKLLQHVSGPTVPLRVLLEGAVRARVVRRDGLVEQCHLCKKQGGKQWDINFGRVLHCATPLDGSLIARPRGKRPSVREQCTPICG